LRGLHRLGARTAIIWCETGRLIPVTAINTATLAGTHSAKEVGSRTIKLNFKPHPQEKFTPKPKETAMTPKTKHLPLASAVIFALATMAGGMVQAQEAAAPAPEAKPDNEIVYNIAVTNDYRFRGYSQTRLKPAVQGGADWVNNPTGFYAGTWASTIKWVKDGGGDASIEWDVYAGKRGNVTEDISYDVGGLGYIYPSNGLNPSANTFELYGQLSAGPVSLKYSHSLTNLFGFADSKNSQYWDAQLNREIADGYIFNFHVGHQRVKNLSAAGYTDWKIGLTKDLGIATLAVAYIDTSTSFYVAPTGKNLGKSGLIVTVSKTF
jgi:uncharacterized protein (TIGR02001 family)